MMFPRAFYPPDGGGSKSAVASADAPSVFPFASSDYDPRLARTKAAGGGAARPAGGLEPVLGRGGITSARPRWPGLIAKPIIDLMPLVSDPSRRSIIERGAVEGAGLITGTVNTASPAGATAHQDGRRSLRVGAAAFLRDGAILATLRHLAFPRDYLRRAPCPGSSRRPNAAGEAAGARDLHPGDHPGLWRGKSRPGSIGSRPKRFAWHSDAGLTRGSNPG